MISLKPVFSKLKEYDAYPKTLEDFRIKTLTGALVTFIATFFMTALFLSELYDFLTPKITEELYVDITRGRKLRINIDTVFNSIPCDLLSLDAVDMSGEQHINIQHNIFKRRLHLNGQPLDEPQHQKAIGHEKRPTVNTTARAITPKEPYCGSCYGAEHGKFKCCNTCDEVKTAYKGKGWAMPNLLSVDQCVKEGITSSVEKIPDEGCQIYGYMEVNRVAGNFHIAPGKSYQHSYLHIHDVQNYKTADFDLSHEVRHLSYGINIPGKTNPMDGHKHITERGAKTISYYLKIVPTMFEKLDGSTLLTNQFSITQHEKTLSLSIFEGGLPGVFFHYEFSPLMVKYMESKRSLGHFLTGLCAIMGGIFTVAGLIDSAIYYSMKALQKKIDLGKAT